MTDETFKNAIFGLFVILLILIGIYFFNNKTSNNVKIYQIPHKLKKRKKQLEVELEKKMLKKNQKKIVKMNN